MCYTTRMALPHTRSYPPEPIISQRAFAKANATDTTVTDIVAAAAVGAEQRVYIEKITLANDNGTATVVTVRDTANGTDYAEVEVPGGGTVVLDFPFPNVWPGVEGEGVEFVAEQATTDVTVGLYYYIAGS